MYHLIDFCRLCLSFKGEFNNICNDNIMEKIVACINDLEFDEKLPALICTNCSEQLDKFFDFRNQCLRSEFLLNCYIDKFPIAESRNKFVNTQLKVILPKNFAASKALSNVQIAKHDSLKILRPNKTKKSSERKSSGILKDMRHSLTTKSNDSETIRSKELLNRVNANTLRTDNGNIPSSDEDDIFLEEEDDENVNNSFINEIQCDKTKSRNLQDSTEDLSLNTHADITELVKIRKRAVQIRAQEKNRQDLNERLPAKEIKRSHKRRSHTIKTTNSKRSSQNSEINKHNSTTDNSTTHKITIKQLICDQLQHLFNNPVTRTTESSKNTNARNLNSASSFMCQDIEPEIFKSVNTTQNSETTSISVIPKTQTLNDISSTQLQNINCSTVIHNTDAANSQILKHLLSSNSATNSGVIPKVYNSTESENSDSLSKNIEINKLKTSLQQKIKNTHHVYTKTSKRLRFQNNIKQKTSTKDNFKTGKPTNITTDTDYENDITRYCIAGTSLCHYKQVSQPASIFQNNYKIPKKYNMVVPKSTLNSVQMSGVSLHNNVVGKTQKAFQSPSNKFQRILNKGIKKTPYSILKKKLTIKRTFSLPNNMLQSGNRNNENLTKSTITIPLRFSNTRDNANTESVQLSSIQVTNDTLPKDTPVTHSSSIITQNSVCNVMDACINEITEPSYNLKEEYISSIFDDDEQSDFKSEEYHDIILDDPIVTENFKEILRDNNKEFKEYFLNEIPSTSATTFEDCDKSLPSEDYSFHDHNDHNYSLRDSPRHTVNCSIFDRVSENHKMQGKNVKILQKKKLRKKLYCRNRRRKPTFLIDDPLNILEPYKRISTISRKPLIRQRSKTSVNKRSRRKRAGCQTSKQTVHGVSNNLRNVIEVDSDGSEIDVVTISESYSDDRACVLQKKREASKGQRLEFNKYLHYLYTSLPIKFTSTRTLKDILSTAVNCIETMKQESQTLEECHSIELSKQKELINRLMNIKSQKPEN